MGPNLEAQERGRDRKDDQDQTLPLITSHDDLFKPSLTKDRFVRLAPFNTPAYITTHPATQFDFAHWLPLLALGGSETWYTFSPAEGVIETSTRQPLLGPPSTTLNSQAESDAKPAGQQIPRIVAGGALQPAPGPVPIKREDGIKTPPPELI
ncbi:hypothetical protein BDW74DRAFT_111581 [Aspergillus multicolor]|uniref:uncharacterized protein n=1 Tax=Aspergillus multicolor TaxID=41759 RepID=UPI003CCD9B4F